MDEIVNLQENFNNFIFKNDFDMAMNPFPWRVKAKVRETRL